MMKPTKTAVTMSTSSTSSGKSSEERRNERNYTGVRKRKWGKYVSEIRLPNSRERIWLGSYDTPEKAARAFDAASYCLRGGKANLNFPNWSAKLADMVCGSGGRLSLTHTEIQNIAAKFANEEHHDQQDQDDQEVISSTVIPSCRDQDHSFSSTTTTTTTTTPIANSEFCHSSEASSSYAASYSSPMFSSAACSSPMFSSITDTDNMYNPSMDWSFLDLLNTQPQSADSSMAPSTAYYGSSIFNDDLPIEYSLPPPENDSYAGEEMSTTQYHQQSFLWDW
ncbi:hypothetical protein MKW92_015669 [Papaver armeniacum]|nr:hypothetical protein MKW92_015669 [Papaver armeniacum]